jgi:hypothetical protein
LIGEELEAKVEACLVLSKADGVPSLIDEILEAGILQPIVTILDTTMDVTLQTASLRVIRKILSGDEAHTQRVLDSSILPIFLKHLIRSPRVEFKKEICWTLSSITAGSPSQLQTVIDSNALAGVVSLIRDVTGTPEELLHDCVLCLASSTRLATEAQMDSLVQMGVLPTLLDMIPRSSGGDLLVVLEGIENILRKHPQSIEGVDDRSLKYIPDVVWLDGEAGERGKRMMELIPSRFAAATLSDFPPADSELFVFGQQDENDEVTWERFA